jgi:hypothetical protein
MNFLKRSDSSLTNENLLSIHQLRGNTLIRKNSYLELS